MIPRYSEAPVATGAVAHTSTATSTGSNSSAGDSIYLWLEALENEVRTLRAQLDCGRCSSPTPPSPRWPGDLWARDSRPPSHTCGRSR